jgi:hypothetical protein
MTMPARAHHAMQPALADEPARAALWRAAAEAVAPAQVATATVLIDTHGHYYPCFDAARFLDAAARNFERHARRAGAAGGPPGHLVIAATRDFDGLGALRREADHGNAGQWRLEPLREPECLLGIHAGSPRLLLIAGHQAATAEGLEVLAIGTAAAVPDGLSLHTTVRLARQVAPIVVIPYGLGKWWRKRGRLLREYLPLAGAGLCLGDSACRPAAAPAPALLRRARALRVPVLAGTDPLPIRRDAAIAGSYGLTLRCPYDPSRPLASLTPALLTAGGNATTFGRRRGPLAALASQALLRLSPRAGAGEGGA